jgi:hypothetical protein
VACADAFTTTDDDVAAAGNLASTLITTSCGRRRKKNERHFLCFFMSRKNKDEREKGKNSVVQIVQKTFFRGDPQKTNLKKKVSF